MPFDGWFACLPDSLLPFLLADLRMHVFAKPYIKFSQSISLSLWPYARIASSGLQVPRVQR